MTVEVRDWRRQEASDVRVVQPAADGGIRARWIGDGRYARPVVRSRRIWFQPPDRLRVEVLDGGVAVQAAVRDGSAWWHWDRDGGESAGDVAQDATVPPLLNLTLLIPARLLCTMWFEVTGIGSRDARRVVRATGTPRQPSSGAEVRCEFEFDLEHGTPLYMATFDAGERVSATEVVSVDYAAAVNSEIFSFEKLETTDGRPPGADRPQRVRPVMAIWSGEWWSALTNHQTIWLTGLPGAGKTTIARATEQLLHQVGIHCCVLDGDQLRQGLSSDLGLSREDRGEQARRVSYMAAILADSGVIPIVALVSPYAADRRRARDIHDAAGVGFLEVWVSTPLEVCMARDPKGLYAAVRRPSSVPSSEAASDGSGLTGLASPYEEPASPDVRVSGDSQHPRVAAVEIVEKLFSKSAQTGRVGRSGVMGAWGGSGCHHRGAHARQFNHELIE
jgi:adenylyl-sulfate kinase